MWSVCIYAREESISLIPKSFSCLTFCVAAHATLSNSCTSPITNQIKIWDFQVRNLNTNLQAEAACMMATVMTILQSTRSVLMRCPRSCKDPLTLKLLLRRHIIVHTCVLNNCARANARAQKPEAFNLDTYVLIHHKQPNDNGFN